MPKVTIDNTRGLVQETGSGLTVESAASFNASSVSPIVKTAQMSASLQIVTATATVANDALSTSFAALVPVGSTVLCGELSVETASFGGTGGNITDVGTANDIDCYSGTIALDSEVVAAQAICPIALPPDADNGSDAAITVRVTHANLGTQDIDAVIRVSLVCVTASTS